MLSVLLLNEHMKKVVKLKKNIQMMVIINAFLLVYIGNFCKSFCDKNERMIFSIGIIDE